MKRSSIRFFHSVVASLVVMISATSAHADLNESCKLQGDYGAVFSGAAGLAKASKKLGASADVVLLEKRTDLARLANDAFAKCINLETARLLKNREPIEMAPAICTEKENNLMNEVVPVLASKQFTDKNDNVKDCYPPQLSDEISKVFNSIIQRARAMRGVAYGHGVEP